MSRSRELRDRDSGVWGNDSLAGKLRLTDSGVIRLRREQVAREPTPHELRTHPTVRNYAIICLVAMIVLLVVLLYQGMGSASLIPVLLGIMGVIINWRAAPILVILAHSGLYYLEMLRYYLIVRMEVFAPPDLGEVLMAAALVVYAACHYRLQGLVHEIVPHEAQRISRRRVATQAQVVAEPSARRSTAVVHPSEYSSAVAAGGWALAALLIWVLLPGQPPTLGGHGEIRASVWRAFLLVWLIGTVLMLLSSILRYLGYRCQSEAEARLFLQDVIWKETHREQRRINRWLTWARLRRQRREEQL